MTLRLNGWLLGRSRIFAHGDSAVLAVNFNVPQSARFDIRIRMD
jgi:hypothetical protein